MGNTASTNVLGGIPSVQVESDDSWFDEHTPLPEEYNDIMYAVRELERRVTLNESGVGLFVDNRDSEWAERSEEFVVQLSDEELDNREFAVLIFGRWLLKFVGCAETIFAADAFPPPQHRSAFGYSYHIDHERGKLYIRRARLETAGDCMIVVLHAAAHLAIKQSATDDDDPVFVREFHRKVSAVLSELFRARFIKKSPRTERKRAALAPTQELEASALPASETNLANLNTAEVRAEPSV